MTRVLLIALGGALGAVSRYLVSAGIQQALPAALPVGTLVVNLSGSLVIGFLYQLSASAIVPPTFREFAAIGFLGSYTTFSTLALETNTLMRDGERLIATVYLAATVGGGLLACVAGMTVGRVVLRGR
jgi:CrcB protein